jgi:hypothetical protein
VQLLKLSTRFHHKHPAILGRKMKVPIGRYGGTGESLNAPPQPLLINLVTGLRAGSK